LEARAEHPGARSLTGTDRGPAVGIDLGTTNSALAWAEPRGAIRLFEVPQLVAAGEAARRATLPSFLYLTDAAQRESGAVALPWNPAPEVVAGLFAREEGALVPSRQIASAKSWLSNPHVDRTAPLLPWESETGAKLSPVEASSRLLMHLRDAWNHVQAGSDSALRLERQSIVVTVPASFDEEARELTVRAAREAGFEKLTLLEEPLAALYAWLAAHRRNPGARLGEATRILVCDVGGGTTDFSVIRATVDGGELTFERIAIGEHLLLGGDNLDLALAVLVEQKLGDPSRLTLAQRQALRRKCSAAKELLLSDPAMDQVGITILGSGRGVIGGGMTTVLTRDDVVRTLSEGFLPITAAADLPPRDRRVGLRELGLPYETEPAITKHLAAFLTRAARGDPPTTLMKPDAVLFNGGFFTPALARERVLDALAAWFGERPMVLENERPEAAVALGAVFYARLRRNPSAAKRLLIRAGSARAYYIGVSTADTPAQGGTESPAAESRTAVCVMARGIEEGTRSELDREFTVVTNQPGAFTLYSSTERHDPVGTIVTFSNDDSVVRHAPLVTVFRFGKRSRRVPLTVGLTTIFTETGTLELWCESRTTDHRWRLAFNLRAAEGDPLDEPDDDAAGEATVIVAEEAIASAKQLIREAFGVPGSAPAPDALIGSLENTLGHGKLAWPLETIRTLADVLLEVERGRTRSAAHEVRWLNLTGFCARPGLGSSLDAWRVSELRKVYAAGLAFPKEVQNQVEWLVLWQRVAAGFTPGQQRELAQRVSGQLGLGQRKAPRLNPQIERESWRLLASLERLDAGQRARFGHDLLARVRREPRNASWLWAMSRLGTRTPLYGPLNAVVAPAVAEGWIDTLSGLKELTPDAAAAIAHIGARTDDAARDISAPASESAAARLEAAGFADAARRLRTALPPDRVDAGRIFGESLPDGLHISSK
jgi:molecular chaperone DnaK (HSP70)